MKQKPPYPLAAELLVVAGYILLVFALTYPLSLHPGSLVVGLFVDAESHMWSYWWMREALLELHTNPFFTTRLYYPEGVSLYFYAYNVVHALLSIPLQSLFGLIVAYNLTEMLGFFGAAWGTYWLARDITGSRRASFVAGVVFGFAPLQVFHFSVGQPNLHGVEFLPVYVLCIRRWLGGGRAAWLFGSAIALALNAFSDWQYALYAQLFTLVLLVALLIGQGRQRRQWRAALWSLGWRTAAVQSLFLLAVAPVLVPMVRELLLPRPYMFRSRRDTIYHSADLLSFLVPNPHHPLWGDWSLALFDALKPPGVLLAFVCLSYGALVLAAVAAVRHWPQARFWVWCGVVFLVLSLGPQLRVGGTVTDIPLPYEVLFQFKVLRVSRAPARYVVITLLCLAVLAALGTRSLLALLDTREHRWQSRGAGRLLPRLMHHAPYALVLLLVCFELLPIPVRAEPPPPVPSFYTDDTLRGAGAVWEWPDPSNRGMYYATIHDRPVLYGEMSRDNPPGPLLSYLRNGLFRDEIVLHETNWACVAEFAHITHMVVYQQGMFDEDADERRTLEEQVLPALSPVRDTPQARLFRAPRIPDDAPHTCVVVGDGWGKPRPFAPDEPIYRWMGQQGSVLLLRQEAGPVTLHFDAHFFAIPRHIQVFRDTRQVGEFLVDDHKPFALPLTLPAGATTLTFRSVEPATPPSDYGYEGETEPVSIGLSRVWVEEQEEQ